MAIDHLKTTVLLIGVSEFPEDGSIDAIPNVLANVKLFRSMLLNNELIGVPSANIIVSLNEDKRDIERKLKQVAELTRDKKSTLLIYYTGHGILSPSDFQLYFTTHRTTRDDLDIDGLSIELFKKHLGRSNAARKIVILDCCHSGAFIGAMGDMPGAIQAGLNEFEGTYVMTSAAGDEPSLYPVESPDKPTYFTGKLIEIVEDGLENDHKFCSLRDIYNKIEWDFKYEGLPRPQQSNFQNADQLHFSVNRKYQEKKPDDELAWDDAVSKNTTWAYIDFKNLYPNSKFNKQAKDKIHDLVEEEQWNKALNNGNAYHFTDYLDKYPDGRFAETANSKLNELRALDNVKEERRFWNSVLRDDNLQSYLSYLLKYPRGKFVMECNVAIANFQLAEQQVQRKKQEEENQKKKQYEIDEKKKRDIEEQARKNLQIEENKNKELEEKRKREIDDQQTKSRLQEEKRREELKRQEQQQRELELAAKLKKEQELLEERKKQEEIDSKKQRELQIAKQEKKQAEIENQKVLERRRNGNLIVEEKPFDNFADNRTKLMIPVIVIAASIVLIIIFIFS